MPPQYKLNDLFNEHFSQLIFFEKYIVAKNWQGGGELLLKHITMDNTLTYHVIDRAGFTLCRASGTLEIFAKSSCQI